MPVAVRLYIFVHVWHRETGRNQPVQNILHPIGEFFRLYVCETSPYDPEGNLCLDVLLPCSRTCLDGNLNASFTAFPTRFHSKNGQVSRQTMRCTDALGDSFGARCVRFETEGRTFWGLARIYWAQLCSCWRLQLS